MIGMKAILRGQKCPYCGCQISEDEPLETEEDIELMERIKLTSCLCPNVKCRKEVKETKSQILKRIKRRVEFA